MEKPFRFIEYKTTHRDEFNVTEGRQPTFAFFYLKEGSFRLRIGDREEIIRRGDCAVFTDDVDFSRSVLEPLSFLYLKFCVNPKCPFTLPLPVGRVEVRDTARLCANLARYEKWRERTDPAALYYREHVLEDILMQISAEYAGEREGEGTEEMADCHDPLVRQCILYIREHLRERLTLDAICRALSTNPTTLNFKFRRELRTSVGEQLTAERMRAARRYLESTTFSVSDIAERCGYESIYYFSTAFRKHHGMAPTAYRRRCRG